jgi:hypothetical protein
MPPAITSTSLLASAIVLRWSIAASTASSASVPLDAHSTRSTSGWDATATRPSRPDPTTVVSPSAPFPARRSMALPLAIAATRGR